MPAAAGPTSSAAAIAAPKRDTATLKALSREISPPNTKTRFASSYEITVLQKPSPRRSRGRAAPLLQRSR